ncbi:hypothetical protein Q8F55_004850 [Vanrija albida]|uniref:F-box domain-containing protein n=1 Tax=Vanrija albida TaxID=181172 RepID=A0ABR3PZZ8_9TREE
MAASTQPGGVMGLDNIQQPTVSAWERRPGAMAVYKSSRARPNKHQYGWGNLPDQLIHRIVSHVNDLPQPELLRPLPPPHAAVARALVQRRWVAAARLVSAGWCAAIDTHPFWTQYEAAINPATSGDDHNNNKTGPSLTPYQSARRGTMSVCIPCRLSLRNPYPGHGLQRVNTTVLGFVASCQFHTEGGFCRDCLRENVLQTPGRDPADPISLRVSDPKDRDITGEIRGRRYTCHSCRQTVMYSMIRRELIKCARGGYIRGLDVPWHYMAPYHEYVWDGEGASDRQAIRIVEELFLAQHTRWTDWERRMLEVQRELMIVKVCQFENKAANVIRNHIEAVRQLCNSVWGEENEDMIDITRLQRAWRQEFETGRYTEREHRVELSRILTGEPQPRLLEYLRTLLQCLCLDRWAYDRVEHGLWVLPSDDVDQVVRPDTQLFTPLREYTLMTFNPLKHDEARFGSHNQQALALGDGQFKWTTPGVILPPERILNIMNEKFTQLLVRRLEIPLATIVEYKRMSCNDDDGGAEKVCDAVQLPDILGLLHNQASWMEGWPFDEAAPPSDAGGDDVVSGTASPASTGSPRIELIEYEEASPRIEVIKLEADGDDNYGVRDGWSSGVDEEEEEEMMSEDDAPLDYTTPDDDEWEAASSETDGAEEEEEEMNDQPAQPVRPRLGDRQETSNSSEGESTRTALVTPDDSPDLLVGSIELAPIDADDAVVFTHAPTTPRNVESNDTAMSPTLGKRKSPGDDDREEPPARRRSPQTSHSDSGSPTLSLESSLESEDKSPVLVNIGSTPSDGVAAPAAPAVAPNTSLPTPPSEEPSPKAERNREAPPPPPPPPRAAPAPTIITMIPAGVEHKIATQRIREDSPESDISSQTSDASWEFPNEAPYVPPRDVQLGPGTTGILTAAWWNACEPVRTCRCSICQRARPIDMFLAATGYVLETQGIHIA